MGMNQLSAPKEKQARSLWKGQKRSSCLCSGLSLPVPASYHSWIYQKENKIHRKKSTAKVPKQAIHFSPLYYCFWEFQIYMLSKRHMNKNPLSWISKCQLLKELLHKKVELFGLFVQLNEMVLSPAILLKYSHLSKWLILPSCPKVKQKVILFSHWFQYWN